MFRGVFLGGFVVRAAFYCFRRRWFWLVAWYLGVIGSLIECRRVGVLILFSGAVVNWLGARVLVWVLHSLADTCFS